MLELERTRDASAMADMVVAAMRTHAPSTLHRSECWSACISARLRCGLDEPARGILREAHAWLRESLSFVPGYARESYLRRNRFNAALAQQASVLGVPWGF
jgi:hypothetical protein